MRGRTKTQRLIWAAISTVAFALLVACIWQFTHMDDYDWPKATKNFWYIIDVVVGLVAGFFTLLGAILAGSSCYDL
jgi:protein-S-isoprenylcysteine O-methyltransferase Ste14